MIAQHAPRTPRPSANLGLPPPLALELSDAEHVVGSVHDDVIAFRGFGSDVEAVHAAWVAHRAVDRRLAQRDGRRPIPVDTARLAVDRRADVERVLADGQPIAILRRAGTGGADGDATYGFELRVPGPVNEVTMRSLAYLAYRTLRKSGVRWALWSRDVRPDDRSRATARGATTPARVAGSAAHTHGAPDPRPSTGDVRWGVAVAALVALAVLALVVPPAVGIVGAVAFATLGALALVGVIELPLRWWERRTKGETRGVGERADGPRTRPRLGAAMAATFASLAALVLAFVVPASLALPLSAIGLAGLLGVRLFAMPAGWPPRRPVRIPGDDRLDASAASHARVVTAPDAARTDPESVGERETSDGGNETLHAYRPQNSARRTTTGVAAPPYRSTARTGAHAIA